MRRKQIDLTFRSENKRFNSIFRLLRRNKFSNGCANLGHILHLLLTQVAGIIKFANLPFGSYTAGPDKSGARNASISVSERCQQQGFAKGQWPTASSLN